MMLIHPHCIIVEERENLFFKKSRNLKFMYPVFWTVIKLIWRHASIFKVNKSVLGIFTGFSVLSIIGGLSNTGLAACHLFLHNIITSYYIFLKDTWSGLGSAIICEGLLPWKEHSLTFAQVVFFLFCFVFC